MWNDIFLSLLRILHKVSYVATVAVLLQQVAYASASLTLICFILSASIIFRALLGYSMSI